VDAALLHAEGAIASRSRYVTCLRMVNKAQIKACTMLSLTYFCTPFQTQLAVAIIVIVWVSALVSSFIDNIPFTTAMVSSLFVFRLSLPIFFYTLRRAVSFYAF